MTLSVFQRKTRLLWIVLLLVALLLPLSAGAESGLYIDDSCVTYTQNPTFGKPVDIFVTPKGEGEISSVLYWITFDDGGYNDSSTDLQFSFVPTYVGWHYAFIRLVDMEGNISEVSFEFEVVDTGITLEYLAISTDEGLVGSTISIGYETRGEGAVLSSTWSVYLAEDYYKDEKTPIATKHTEGAIEKYPFVIPGTKEYVVELSVTNENGNTSRGIAYIYGYDENTPRIIGCSFSKNTIKLGESVTLTANVAGTGIERLVYEVYDSFTGECVFTEETKETSVVFTPSAGGRYYLCVGLSGTEGESDYEWGPFFTVKEGLFLKGVSTNKREFSLGETVTLNLITEGEGTPAKVRYLIQDADNWQELESIETTGTTLQYTPAKGGDFFVDVTMTNDKGIKYFADVYFSVYAGLRPVELKASDVFVSIGDSIKFTPVLKGEGTATKVVYSIQNADYSYHEDFQGTVEGFVWTPTVCGTYYCDVVLTNDLGYTYSAFTQELTVLGQGLTVLGMKASNNHPSVGEEVTISADVVGNGNVISANYQLEYVSDQYSWMYELVDSKQNQSLTYSFIPEKEGMYSLNAHYIMDDNSVWDGYYSVEVHSDHAYLNGLSFQKNEIALGETVNVTAEVIGSDVENISVTVRKADNGYYSEISSFDNGTNPNISFTPSEPGDYIIDVCLTNSANITWFYSKDVKVYDGTKHIKNVQILPGEKVSVNQPVTFNITYEGTGKIVEEKHEIVFMPQHPYSDEYTGYFGVIDSWTGTESSYTYTPKKAGFYSYHITVVGEKATYDYYESFEAVTNPDQFVLNSLTLDKAQCNVGENIVATANTSGKGDVETYEYYVYNSLGQVVNSYAGLTDKYTFSLTEGGDYVVRVYVKMKDGNIYQADSSTLTINSPVQPIQLIEFYTDVENLNVGEQINFALNYTGNDYSNVGRMLFYTYDGNGQQIGDPWVYDGFIGHYGFISSAPGYYAIRVFMLTYDGGEQVVTSPFFNVTDPNAKPIELIEFYTDVAELKVGEQINFALRYTGNEYSNVGRMLFYTYDGNGQQIGDPWVYDGFIGHYGFISSAPGYYAIRVFMLTHDGGEQVVTSPFFMVYPAANEEPVVEPSEEPTEEPVVEPSEEATEEPVVEPTEEPTEEPVVEPAEEPVDQPAVETVVEPIEEIVEET